MKIKRNKLLFHRLYLLRKWYDITDITLTEDTFHLGEIPGFCHSMCHHKIAGTIQNTSRDYNSEWLRKITKNGQSRHSVI